VAGEADVQVGVQLVGYATRLTGIISTLRGLSVTAHAAASLVGGDGGCYDGQARRELQQFYDSYATNVDKLIGFDQAGVQFLQRVVDEFDYTEADLDRLVTILTGGGQ
jgi:hypothetical protein